jgi:hypothetical protein
MFGFRNQPPINTLAGAGAPGLVRDRYNEDGTPYSTIRLYNAVGSALVAGRPYTLKYDGDLDKMVLATTPATGSTVAHYVVVATEDVPAASFGEFCFWGVCSAFVLGTSVVKDDFLKVTPNISATAFEDNGTSITANSVAIATEAQALAGAHLARIFLLGLPVVVGN